MYLSYGELEKSNIVGNTGEARTAFPRSNPVASLISTIGIETTLSRLPRATTSPTSPSNNVKSIPTSEKSSNPSILPESSLASLNILQSTTNGPLVVSDDSGLPRGAIIGITLGAIVGFIVVVFIIDVLLLSNRVRRNFRRIRPGRKNVYSDEKPLVLPRSNTIQRKPLAPAEVPFYDKEIKRSRALSLDSASRYSRSTWGWSGENEGTTLRGGDDDGPDDEWKRKSVDYYRHSVSVFDDDGLDKWKEDKGRTYYGPIKPGMGVQKRDTGSSFGIVDENRYTMSSFDSGLDLDDIDEKAEKVDYSKKRKLATWILNDPLERWRIGLHPLAGRRGEGFERITYYK